ncbi:sulfite oxidase-like oxidoreductase [Microtetraspora sp. AC03309]|nr:sulfite oxidase-like oxidoreductase [Microtetraspora sp. AC03309]
MPRNIAHVRHREWHPSLIAITKGGGAFRSHLGVPSRRSCGGGAGQGGWRGPGAGERNGWWQYGDVPEIPEEESRLPPGQYIPRGRPVIHYGRVPAFRPQSWRFQVFGATASGDAHMFGWEEFAALPRTAVIADFHCVTKFSIMGNEWSGIGARTLLEEVPPAPGVRHVMIWAEYGYSANIRMDDFDRDTTLFATDLDDKPLSPERGFPVRIVVPHLYAWKSVKWVRGVEYLTEDRRGFWEERGYHNIADPWREQRYSYQEEPGEGPP